MKGSVIRVTFATMLSCGDHVHTSICMNAWFDFIHVRICAWHATAQKCRHTGVCRIQNNSSMHTVTSLRRHVLLWPRVQTYVVCTYVHTYAYTQTQRTYTYEYIQIRTSSQANCIAMPQHPKDVILIRNKSDFNKALVERFKRRDHETMALILCPGAYEAQLSRMIWWNYSVIGLGSTKLFCSVGHTVQVMARERNRKKTGVIDVLCFFMCTVLLVGLCLSKQTMTNLYKRICTCIFIYVYVYMYVYIYV
jgi:hypothetical protein